MFPKYKTKKILFIEIRKERDNWEDLGEVESKGFFSYKNNKTMFQTEVCDFCKKRINIGRENNKLFKYCSRCMVKIE